MDAKARRDDDKLDQAADRVFRRGVGGRFVLGTAPGPGRSASTGTAAIRPPPDVFTAVQDYAASYLGWSQCVSIYGPEAAEQVIAELASYGRVPHEPLARELIAAERKRRADVAASPPPPRRRKKPLSPKG
jgi:hypothetical protein